MPECGIQILWCDVPIRFDTYRGCSFGCLYCREHKKHRSGLTPEIHETDIALKRFIKGHRICETKWCDWDIPIQFGTISDPFQPYELVKGLSYKCLKIFAESYYPLVITTKSTLISRLDYLSVLSQCNAVVQVSMASEKYKGLEPYAPSFKDRLKQLPLLSSNAKRVLVRTQPYLRPIKRDIIANLQRYRDSGVHGLIISTISLTKKRQGFIKHGDMYLYPENQMFDDYSEIRQACHDNKLKFYCADGRLRWELSDSLTCCGCAGVDGFKVNTANLNHEDRVYTDKMKEIGTGEVFGNIHQREPKYSQCKASSYMAYMERYRDRD